VADFQSNVPKRIQHAVNQLGQIRQRPAHCHLAVVQKHEVNVAVRIQFRAAITPMAMSASGGNSFCACGDKPPAPIPKGAAITRRALPRAPGRFCARRAAAMQQLEPVRFNLEKRLQTRRVVPPHCRRFQRQTRFGVVLDFFEQILHGIKDVAPGSQRELKI